MSEKRLSTSQFKELLMEYNSQNPTMLGKMEFEEWLNSHILSRYTIGDNLLTEVQNELKKLSNDYPSSSKELDLAIKKIEDAAVFLSHGAAGYNKGAIGKLTLLNHK